MEPFAASRCYTQFKPSRPTSSRVVQEAWAWLIVEFVSHSCFGDSERVSGLKADLVSVGVVHVAWYNNLLMTVVLWVVAWLLSSTRRIISVLLLHYQLIYKDLTSLLSSGETRNTRKSLVPRHWTVPHKEIPLKRLSSPNSTPDKADKSAKMDKCVKCKDRGCG